ncbi:MAG: ATP-binding protein [Candidatus Thermoplasmatota archaeon]
MMSKEVFRQVVIQQKNDSVLPGETVLRENIDDIVSWFKDPRILILTGLRRSGKSTLLKQLIHQNKNMCYVNFDDERFLEFNAKDFEQLHEILLEVYPSPKFYFFDEIQNIDKFETFVRRLHDQGKKIIITGSNASLLSKEFGTRLTGRYKAFEVYPFSFREFLRFKKSVPQKDWLYLTEKKVHLIRLFDEYMIHGGIPEYLKTRDKEYLHTLYNNILYRDIIARYMIKRQKTLKELVNILMTTIASPFTYNSLKKTLQLSNSITVKEYISYLCNSYLFFEVQRFDYSLKKQLNAPKKIYTVDPAFHYVCGTTFSSDKGQVLENLVFLELKRQKKDVYYFTNHHECDFLVKEDTRICEAIQVCYVLDEGDKEREVAGLLEAMEMFHLKEGLLLTKEQEEEIHVANKTIQVLPVWKWLLGFS